MRRTRRAFCKTPLLHAAQRPMPRSPKKVPTLSADCSAHLGINQTPPARFARAGGALYDVVSAKGLLPNALVGVVAPHVGLLFLVGEAF